MQNPLALQMILDPQMAEVFERLALTNHQQIDADFDFRIIYWQLKTTKCAGTWWTTRYHSNACKKL